MNNKSEALRNPCIYVVIDSGEVFHGLDDLFKLVRGI